MSVGFLISCRSPGIADLEGALAACGPAAASALGVSMAASAWVVQRHLSNTVSFVFYGMACLIRLIEFDALFATFDGIMY